MKTWDREGMVKVDVPYLLPVLNEALQLSPVLLQAYSYGPYGTEPQTADVIFPIEDCLVPESANESTYAWLSRSDLHQEIFTVITFTLIRQSNDYRNMLFSNTLLEY